MNRLPPLNALHAFEAVAKRLSIKKAAEDLLVTQSAVSQQIRNLEAFFEAPLFVRTPQGLVLSELGERLIPAVSQAFDLLRRTSERCIAEKRPVTVSVSSSFAMAWLMPRLLKFESSNPGVSVRVLATSGQAEDTLAEDEKGEIQVVYSLSPGDKPDLLLEEWLLPVCSPGFLKEEISCLHDLGECRLLFNTPSGTDWRLWARHHGAEQIIFPKAYESAMKMQADVVAIEMATAGYGIALANLHYVADKLDMGILVPAATVRPMRLGCHVLKMSSVPSDNARLLAAWLEDEARNSLRAISSYIDEKTA